MLFTAGNPKKEKKKKEKRAKKAEETSRQMAAAAAGGVQAAAGGGVQSAGSGRRPSVVLAILGGDADQDEVFVFGEAANAARLEAAMGPITTALDALRPQWPPHEDEEEEDAVAVHEVPDTGSGAVVAKSFGEHRGVVAAIHPGVCVPHAPALQ
jgi:hypothetical protein